MPDHTLPAGPAGVEPLGFEDRRDTSRDGWRNRLEFAALTGFKPFWLFANGHPGLARFVNKLIVGNAVLKVPSRPLALSTAGPYASWRTLNDRTWFARYLPPAPQQGLPDLDDVAELFRVRPDGPRLSQRSTLLFPAFAQWFTDGFLMTDPRDTRRTTTSHQIDLGQVYGLTGDVTLALRVLSNEPGRRGRLKSAVTNGEEWAPRLYDEVGGRVPEFAPIPVPSRLPADWPREKLHSLFAFGGERANSTPFTAMLSTLFLREHNRLCGVLEAAYPAWDDDRVFETARCINIVQLIKVVVEQYINHVSPYWFRLLGDPTPCYRAAWNRTNWIPVEFNLLYRWHSLVPDRVRWGGAEIPMTEARFDNRLLLRDGLAAGFRNASRTKAWQLGLFNTADFLLPVEKASVEQGRRNELASYNDYREVMKYPRLTRFEQINGDLRVVEELRRVYGSVDRIEYFVGLFAEGSRARSAVPALIGRMVAADAFSHALTNPLLSPHVFHAGTFTAQGMTSIQSTSRLTDMLGRVGGRPGAGLLATMEQDEVPAGA